MIFPAYQTQTSQDVKMTCLSRETQLKMTSEFYGVQEPWGGQRHGWDGEEYTAVMSIVVVEDMQEAHLSLSDCETMDISYSDEREELKVKLVVFPPTEMQKNYENSDVPLVKSMSLK